MNQTDSPPTSFDGLRQATMVILLFQIVFLIAKIFNEGESSGGMSAILAATVMLAALNRRLSADPAGQGQHATFYVVLWRYGSLTLLGVFTAVIAFKTYAPASVPNGMPTFIAMVVSAVIALKGAALGKLKPNGVFGLRLRWTRQSRLAWEQAHRLMGRILFFGGSIGVIVAPFVPALATLGGIAVVVLIGVTAGAFKSWRVWQSDPERGLPAN